MSHIKTGNYLFIYLTPPGEEVLGALYKDDVRVTEPGFWRTTDPKVASKKAIDSYELVQEINSCKLCKH